MTAKEDRDLLNPDSWTSTSALASSSHWNGGDFKGWLEGNAVVTRNGGLVDILRVAVEGQQDKAAIVHVDWPTMATHFDPQTGLIDFPGGATKFTIRFDPQSDLYYSLANVVPLAYRGNPLTFTRNTLALVTSSDLRDWTVQSVVLFHPNRTHHGFQYADWLFEGEDIIFISRTAYDDAEGGAHNLHDANYLTFHRIPNFRQRTLAHPTINNSSVTGNDILKGQNLS